MTPFSDHFHRGTRPSCRNYSVDVDVAVDVAVDVDVAVAIAVAVAEEAMPMEATLEDAHTFHSRLRHFFGYDYGYGYGSGAEDDSAEITKPPSPLFPKQNTVA